MRSTRSSCFTAGLILFAGTALGETESPEALKRLSLEELMDIEVTSVSKHPEKLSEAASAIQVITQDDIRRYGATNIPEALRLATNLQVAQIDSGNWAITARGFNSALASKMLVMIDRRTVYSPLFAGTFWDAQDVLLEDVDRIEVISGPGGTQWGANAVNGVINIITKGAKDTQGVYAEAGGGNELKGFTSVRYGGSLGPNANYRVYGKYTDQDDLVRPDGSPAGDNRHMGQGGMRMDWQASSADLVTLQGDYYDNRRGTFGPTRVTADGGNALTRWTHTFSEVSNLQLQLYFDRAHRRNRNSWEDTMDTYDLDFQHRFPLAEGHDFTWGLGYRLVQDEFNSDPLLAMRPERRTLQTYSAFGQDEIALIEDKLHLTLGTKIEHYVYGAGFQFQPSGRLTWKVTEDQTLWAAISRAVRLPSRIDRDLYSPQNPPFFLAGGPHFRPEEVVTYELGYRIQPLPRLALALSTFYNDYDRLRSIEFQNPPLPIPTIVANQLYASSLGAEVTADYRVTDWWRLRAGYTELHVNLNAKAGSNPANVIGPGESQDPKRYGSLRSSLNLPGHLELDATFRYVDRIDISKVPAYGELDVRLGWRPIPEVELSVVGQNLLRDHHAEFQPTPREEVERGVYGKVALRF